MPRCRWNPRLLLGTLLASACLAGTTEDARACSCIPIELGFLDEGSITLPRNARGIPWSGYVQASDPSTPPLGTRFRLEIARGASWSSIPFEVIPVEDVPVGSAKSLRGDELHVVVPRGGLSPGARYRVSYSSSMFLRRLLGKSRSSYAGSETLFVEVSKAEFLPEPGMASLSISAPTTGKVTTSSSGGMCATTFIGRKAVVAFKVPAEHDRWAVALVYTVFVDGSRVWRPDSSLCDRTATGQNSLGRGRELLFASCPQEPPKATDGHIVVQSDLADAVLSRGVHDVEVIASLPGTAIRFSARGKVDLSCSP